MPKMLRKLHIKEDFTPTSAMSIVDSNGQTVQITDSANDGKALPEKLSVVVEATHTGINRNKVHYSYDSLSKSTDSWTKNYGKPVLLNHDSHSDPLGRVRSADFKQSVIDPEKHTIQLSLDITNKAAIERFLDGRYTTFSIGGYTDSATCSICNKDQMTDGFCGHQRGKTYDGKECFWNLGMMDYDEISVVNCPADVNAQAISLSVVGEDGQEDSVPEGTVEPDAQGDSSTIDEGVITDGILDNIDGILGHVDDSAGIEPVADDSSDEPISDDTSSTDDSIESLQAEIAILKDKVATLESEIEIKEGIIATKDSEIESLEAERDTLKTELATATEDSEGMVKQNASLAKFAHSILAERVIDLQIVSGDKSIEDKEQLLKDYSVVTSKKLNDMINELYKPERITQRVKATSPGLATNDGIVDGEGFEKPGSQPKIVTLKDATETMKNFLVNRKF